MAGSKKIILLAWISFFLSKNLFSQDVCSRFKHLIDSVGVNKYKFVYLYYDTVGQQDSTFDQWIKLTENERKAFLLDSFWVSASNLEETFECFDSSIRRLNYESFIDIDPSFMFSSRDRRLVKKRAGLYNKWIKISQKDETSKRLQLLNAKMVAKKYNLLSERISLQKPVLIVPYRVIRKDHVAIACISVITNGFKMDYYSISYADPE